MRYVILRKADQFTESGMLPNGDLLKAMGTYNDEMVQAGVMLGGEGLHSSATGARLRVSKGNVTVTDGPFAEAKEVIAGFVMIEASSLEEAVQWAARCPSLKGDCDAEIEVRQVIEASDFPPGLEMELARMPWSSVAAPAKRQVSEGK